MNFSWIKLFLTSFVFRSLRLFKIKTEEQTISTENLTEKAKLNSTEFSLIPC